MSRLKVQSQALTKPLAIIGIFSCQLAEANDFSVIGEFASEPMSRGISQSPNDPIARLLVEWDHQNGLFAGAMLYSSSKSPEPWRTQGVSVHSGWFKTIADTQALEFSINKHHFPGDLSSNWDYEEFQVNYHLSRSLSFSFSISDDYFGRSSSSRHFGFHWQHTLNDDFYVFANTGVRDFSRSIYVGETINSSLGLGYIINSDWDLKLSIENASENIETFIGPKTAGTRLFASISYLIF